eukprot:756868-Prorocentrum_lima.AAC.1
MVGAPDWAQALFNQMTMMLNRQEEIVQDVKAIKKEGEDMRGRQDKQEVEIQKLKENKASQQ